MKIIDVQTEGLKQTFKVNVSNAAIEEMVSKKLDEIGQQVSLPGFRKGKTPKSFLRQKYGASVVGEAIEDVVRNSSNQIIKEKDLRPALQPKFEISSYAEGQDLEFTMDVEVLPEIKLVKLSDISLNKEVAEVTEEEVNKAIDRISLNIKDSEVITEDRGAKKGEITVIDFVGKVDGVEFPGGKGNGFQLELGSGSFIPGFEDQLIGAKAGDKVTVSVKFPEAYHSKDLQGKDAEFDVTVHELKQVKKPEINDELAKKFGQESLQALKDLIKAEISKEYENMSRSYLKKELLDILSDKHVFELPETMVSLEFDAIWRQLEDAKKHNRLDESDKNKSEDELRAEYKDIAARRVKLGIVLAEIGRVNNLSVESDDINKALIAEARRYPGQEAAVIEFYKKNPHMLENIKAPIFEEKVVDFILSNAKVTESKTTIEALEKRLQGEEESAPKKSTSKAKTDSAEKKPAKKAAAKKESK